MFLQLYTMEILEYYKVNNKTIIKHLNIMKWLWKFKSKQQEKNINKLLIPIIILEQYILDKKTIMKQLNIMKRLWIYKSKQHL